MADRVDIDIPNDWEPRPHQLPLWRYMVQDKPGLRAAAVWHRRGGKDSTLLNVTAVKSHQRKGTYWHMLPEKEQARKAIWNGIDIAGRRIIDQVFPMALRLKTIDDEMRIDLKCGSVWQVVGSDHFNSLVGANPVGVVLSEYSVGNPAAWDYIRPILLENGGWAAFPYTPRGKNHGHTLFEMARKNPQWFAELLTVDDTHLITPEMIQSERDSGMDDDMILQEYFCSFEGVRQGSIYGEAMARARREGRIMQLVVDRRFPVNTFWDIGHADGTAIVFHQDVGGGKHHFVRSYEAQGQDIGHYVQYLKDTGYMFGRHFLPHDSKNVTLSSKGNPAGDNVWDQMISAGMPAKDMVIVPRTPDLWTAISGVRARMDGAFFDEENAAGLISALTSYRKKWDDVRKCYASVPYKDWTSEYVDAFRQWSQGYTATANAGSFTRPQAAPGVQMQPPRITVVANRRAGY